MKARLHEEAEKEVEAAFDYYEAQRDGLGVEFLDEFGRATRRVVATPSRWPVLWKNIRKCRFDRFPYALLYGPSG